ncbi:MAG TPA: ATP-binding protein [Mycobacteriales bacterium]|nr:ATP-binding protein [Mycobacteriales bacterium]
MEPSEEILRGLLAATPDALLAVDAEGTVVFVNDQVEPLFGWPRESLLGQPIELLVPARFSAGHPRLRGGYVNSPATRPMGAGLELWASRRDGTEFPAEISLSAVNDDDGAMLVLAAVRDVSDRLELEAERQRQALEAQREQSHRLESLGQLAGGIAHDFNNLLGVILNYATLLSRSVIDETAQADVGEIRSAAERGAGLVRQLLTFARRDVVNPEPIEVSSIVRDVASMLRRTIGEQVDLRLDLADVPLTTLADRHQIEQIVLNLALNARDAVAGGGRVTIATSEGSGPDGRTDVVLQVIDTGHGMPPDVVSRVFEPFFTTKPRGQGTGMGLATVHGIVHQAGGEVTIVSEPGEGTTVTVVLRGSDAEPSAPPAPAPPERTAGTGRLLLVEDEASLRFGTARILSVNGYEVLAAADGVEALEMYEEMDGAFDVVVTDVVMPRMRGDELAQELHERDAGLPILFLSGYDSEEHAPLQGRLLPKPVPEDALLRAIREVVRDRA